MRLQPADSGTKYARTMPNLGFDPTPGDVGLSESLARMFNEMAGELRSVATQIEMLDFRSWQGQAGNAAKSLIHDDLLPALGDAATIASQIAGGVSPWSGQLSDFQSEADTLERQAGNAAADLATLKLQHATADDHAKRLLQSHLDDAQSKADGASAAANDLHDRFLKAGEAAGRDASGEDSSAFINATENFNKVTGGTLTPFQLVAGDAWVDLVGHVGAFLREQDIHIENVEGMERGAARLQAIKNLGLDWDEDFKEIKRELLPARALPDAVQGYAADHVDVIRGASLLTAWLGMSADLGAEISPEDKGALGDLDKSIAVVNGSTIALDAAGGLDYIAAANSLDWVPGAGEGVIVSTGAYLAGDWLYHHWSPAHESMNSLTKAPSNIWNTIKDGILEGSFFRSW